MITSISLGPHWSQVIHRVVPDPTDAELFIQKILKPNGFVTNQRQLTFTLNVIVTGDPVLEVTFKPSELVTDTKLVCLDEGDSFNVVEGPSQTSEGFSFIRSTNQECTGESVQSGQTFNCVFTNTLTGGDNTGGIDIDASGAGQSDDVSSQQGITLEQTVTTGGIQGPLATQVTGDGRLTNSPFTACKDQKVDDNTVIRKASSAKYIINGRLPLDRVQETLEALKTKTVTIQIYSDLDPLDMVSSSVASPQFTGKIIIEGNREGDKQYELKQKIVNYNILDIRTECMYITLAEAKGPATNANVAPLGELANTESKNIRPPETDKLLWGGNTVSSSPAKSATEPGALNPPFAVCAVPDNSDETTISQADRTNFAIYNLRGEVKNVELLSGNNLALIVTADQYLAEADLAKLVNNNNPFIKTDLLIKEDKYDYTQPGFELTDLWTDCKDLALTTDPVFEPILGETSY